MVALRSDTIANLGSAEPFRNVWRAIPFIESRTIAPWCQRTTFSRGLKMHVIPYRLILPGLSGLSVGKCVRANLMA